MEMSAQSIVPSKGFIIVVELGFWRLICSSFLVRSFSFFAICERSGASRVRCRKLLRWVGGKS